MRVWHDDEGWGVIDADATPGGCWAHYSDVLVGGYRSLEDAQRVLLRFEAPGQDGYGYRAVEVWPADREPVRTEPDDDSEDHGDRSSDSMRSTLRITFDDPGQRPGAG